ncbi:MAG: hypothetical protein J5802_10160 [Butyrivibrio sp.]|nr:hypothetical protein [Butyrivibrio sp.]
MKKRIPATLTLIILSLCLSACHAKGTTPEQVDSAQAEVSANPQSAEETDEYPLFYENTPLLGYQSYLVDKNGNKKCNVTEKIQAILEQNGVDSENLGMYSCYFINGIFYCVSSFEEDTDVAFYAVDINNNRMGKVTDNTFIDYIDYYNGKLCIGFFDPDGKNSSEYTYTVSDDFSFTPETTDHQNILDYIGAHTTPLYKIEKTPNCAYRTKGSGFSISRALDEAGYVLASRFHNEQKEYIRIFPDGTSEEIKELKNITGHPLYYDKDRIILAADELNTIEYADEVYTLDLKSGTLEHFPDLGEIIQLDGNKVFHRRKDGSLYAFDLIEKKDSLIYKFEETPGVPIDSYHQYQILNGNVFVCDYKDAELKWFRLTGCEEGASTIDIECPIETFSAYKIGTVTSNSSDYKCPFCGNELLDSNYELFKLNDGYSEHTEDINKKLKEKMDYFLDHPEDDYEIKDDSDCEYHSDPDHFVNYRGESVGSANIYNSRFLAVDMEYFWYGGGPHGLYHTDIYVFDLSTGEELGIKNFYPGTEAEFKTLIAEKVKEDFHENQAHYEGRSESDCYDSAYKLVSFDSTNIRYYDDHITYCFNVYEMGSYAASEYLIDVTYEELNGNKELTRVR